jgi:putative ABC transport system permease protein
MTMLPDTIVGSDPALDSLPGVRHVGLAQGRELTTADAHSNSAVLGSDIALRNKKSVGDDFVMRGETFKVVGIYETTTAFPDSTVRVPLAAGQRLFIAAQPEQYQAGLQGTQVYTTIAVYAASGVDTDQLAAQIVAAAPDTQTETSKSVVKEIGSITKIFNAILVGIGLISLLIGGLSVINTMAMAVAERTREIGIKRAIGGSRARVVREIVGESAFIGFIGGLVGLALGGTIVLVGNEMGRSTNSILFDLTAATAATSVGFATILGALAGLIPAVNAARMDPVAALRYE